MLKIKILKRCEFEVEVPLIFMLGEQTRSIMNVNLKKIRKADSTSEQIQSFLPKSLTTLNCKLFK